MSFQEAPGHAWCLLGTNSRHLAAHSWHRSTSNLVGHWHLKSVTKQLCDSDPCMEGRFDLGLASILQSWLSIHIDYLYTPTIICTSQVLELATCSKDLLKGLETVSGARKLWPALVAVMLIECTVWVLARHDMRRYVWNLSTLCSNYQCQPQSPSPTWYQWYHEWWWRWEPLRRALGFADMSPFWILSSPIWWQIYANILFKSGGMLWYILLG